MDAGPLAGLIFLISMGVGAVAIIAFCLHVMLHRRFACDAELGSVTGKRSQHFPRNQHGQLSNTSDQLPPPPPLFPPPPPSENICPELSVISNDTFMMKVVDNGYHSTLEMVSLREDTTLPYVLLTTDFLTLLTSRHVLVRQNDGLRVSAHFTETVSVISEGDEDATVSSYSDVKVSPKSSVSLGAENSETTSPVSVDASSADMKHANVIRVKNLESNTEYVQETTSPTDVTSPSIKVTSPSDDVTTSGKVS